MTFWSWVGKDLLNRISKSIYHKEKIDKLYYIKFFFPFIKRHGYEWKAKLQSGRIYLQYGY